MTPREALEALGFRINAPRDGRVRVYGPEGGSWEEHADWPDSPAARKYIAGTLLREAEERASNTRAVAESAQRDAVAAEARAARLRAVAGRLK
jgi:hypothetical protein